MSMSRSGNKASTVIERFINGRPEPLEHLLVSLRLSSSDNNAIIFGESSIRESYSLRFILVHALHVQLGTSGAKSIRTQRKRCSHLSTMLTQAEQHARYFLVASTNPQTLCEELC